MRYLVMLLISEDNLLAEDMGKLSPKNQKTGQMFFEESEHIYRRLSG